MNYQNLIGYPLNKAEEILQQNNVQYEVKEVDGFLKNYDTKLVVNVLENNNFITLIVDKFLINI